MKRLSVLAIAGAVGLLTSGAVVASALQDAPQDAQPAQDPIGDLLREGPPVAPPETGPIQEAAPAGTPAPAAPIVIQVPGPVAIAEVPEEEPEEEDVAPVVEKAEVAIAPDRRQRRKFAIVEAIDKVTAERMRFQVEVGGRPVRFNKSLIFTARACEVSAAEELVEDSIAYLDVSLEPRGTLQGNAPRQIFRGWMFASTPAVSGLQHPLYDAWVVGCKA